MRKEIKQEDDGVAPLMDLHFRLERGVGSPTSDRA